MVHRRGLVASWDLRSGAPSSHRKTSGRSRASGVERDLRHQVLRWSTVGPAGSWLQHVAGNERRQRFFGWPSPGLGHAVRRGVLRFCAARRLRRWWVRALICAPTSSEWAPTSRAERLAIAAVVCSRLQLRLRASRRWRHTGPGHSARGGALDLEHVEPDCRADPHERQSGVQLPWTTVPDKPL